MKVVQIYLRRVKILNIKDYLVLKNVLISGITKGGSYALYFASIPLYLQYFDADESRAGVWFTIISISTWILVFDLGIGNGLRNRLSIALAKGRTTTSTYLIATTYILNVIFSLGVFSAMIIAMNSLEYLEYFEKLSIGGDELRALYYIAIGISLQFVLRTGVFILYAQHRSGMVGLFNLVTNLLMFLYLYGISEGHVKFDKETASLAIVFVGAMNLPLMFFTGTCLELKIKHFFRKDKNHFRLIKIYSKKLLSSGAGYFSNQLLYMALVQSNVIIIAVTLSPADVVPFAVCSSVFMLFLVVTNLAMNPVWSLVTLSQYQLDSKWILKWMKLSLLGLVILLVIQLIVALNFDIIYLHWFSENKNKPNIDSIQVYSFAFYTTALSMQSVASTFACGFERIGFQRRFYLLILFVKILLIVVASGMFPNYYGWPLILMVDGFLFAMYFVCEGVRIRKYIKEKLVVENDAILKYEI